jgi:hypothetical protein
MTDEKCYKGLSGWLVLVGIGIVLTPFRLLISSISLFRPLFADGYWEALTTPGSEHFTPYFETLIIGEICFNGLMFLASIYLVYLYFSKHYLFPKVYIGIVVASLIFIPFDAWLASLVFPQESMFDSDTIKGFLKVVVAALIWVPYMLVSKRVKATFVEHRPNDYRQAVV